MISAFPFLPASIALDKIQIIPEGTVKYSAAHGNGNILVEAGLHLLRKDYAITVGTAHRRMIYLYKEIT